MFSQRHLDKVAAHSGTYNAKLTEIQGGAFWLGASAVKDLADEPEAAFMSVDHKIQAHSIAANAHYGERARRLECGYVGNGIGVAVIDSGINGRIQYLVTITDNYQDVCNLTAVWGSTVVRGSTAVWGPTAVWGSSRPGASSAYGATGTDASQVALLAIGDPQ